MIDGPFVRSYGFVWDPNTLVWEPAEQSAPGGPGSGLTDAELRATPVPVSGSVTAVAQPGVDIGDVTINNAAGAAAVNIQDGGNAITVDGTITANQGTAAGPTVGWPVQITDAGGQIAGVNTSNELAVSINGWNDANVDGVVNPSIDDNETPAASPPSASFNYLFNGLSSDWNRMRTATAAVDSFGVGIQAVQIIGQFDDVAPSTVSESKFGNLRMSTNRNLYGTIRDAAGNERGANVTSGSALLVDTSSFGKTITRVSVSQGAAGTTVLAAASPSNKHKVMGGMLVADLTGTTKFTDGAGDLTGAMALMTNGGFVWPTSILPYLETTIVNTALNLVTTVGPVKGFVLILTEP